MSRIATERAPTRKAQQGAESRRRILDVASMLMAERGFAGTSISEVSRRSGLPASSIYWHFESKEGLLGAVVEEGAQRWFEELGAAAKTSAGAPIADEMLGSHTAAALAQRPEFLRLLFLIALERKHIDKTSLGVIRRVRKLALVRLREGIARRLAAQGVANSARLADDLSLFALAVADGTFIQNHIDPRASGVARNLELLERALSALGRELRSAE
ncbi:MAG: TetR/AcrR family transcriptional regulator [Myxococcota bacterium]